MNPQEFLRRYGILLLPLGLGGLIALAGAGWYLNFMWQTSLAGQSEDYGAMQVPAPKQPSGAEWNLGR